MDSGWVSIHRKLKEKGYYKKSQYVHLWIHLILSANHNTSEFFWNKKNIIVKPGQFITGRKALSSDTGIPESTVEDILNFLERQQQIKQEKTTKFRLITILKWKEYQKPNNKSNNRATTEQQQADTNNNDNKNNKNIARVNLAPKFSMKEYLKEMENHKARHINVIGHYFEEKGLSYDTREQANIAVKRHLRAATGVAKFSDNQIVKATKQAKKEYSEVWTVETILKILTR